MKLRSLLFSLGAAALFAGGTAQAQIVTNTLATFMGGSRIISNAVTWNLLGELAMTNTVMPGFTVSNNLTLTRDQTWLLGGPVYVLSNAVLNIEAGTVIKGVASTTNASQIAALYVCRGGKINANGTANSPIIFTTIFDDEFDNAELGIYTRGLWGGIVMFGQTPLNTASLAAGNSASPKFDVYEGLSTNVLATNILGGTQQVFLFGGNNDNDSSGVLRYVSIRHGGKKLESNKELNGLSMCAVGRGTTIEFVESYATADDGFEFFGGTVNTRYLVSAFNDDDSFDTDQGYSGKNQFWFSIHEPGTRDKGHELNGEPEGLGVGNLPLARYEVYNETSIGAGTNSGGTGNNAFTIRTFASPRFFNSIFTDYAQRGATIDLTCVTNLNNGDLDFRDNIWWGFTGGTDPNSITNICVSNAFQIFFTDAARNNTITDPQIAKIGRVVFSGLDPRPLPGSPALTSTRTAPENGFYVPVGYKGAFSSNNWAADWTAIGHYGIMSGAGAAVPRDELLMSIVPKVTTLGAAGAMVDTTFTLSFETLPGWNYQAQCSTNLVEGIGYTNFGPLINGSGSIKSVTDTAATGDSRFYRVRAVVP